MKTKLFALAVATAAMGMFAWTGCDDHDDADHGHGSSFPSCEAIINACHEVDRGEPGTIHDCHETAHDLSATEAACAAVKDNCVATCAAAKLDAGADGGETHAGH